MDATAELEEAATDTDATEKPKKRIHWTDEQQALVIAEGHRIRAVEPKISVSRLIKRAQLVLDEQYHRNVDAFGRVSSNMWFWEAMEGTAKIDTSFDGNLIHSTDMVLASPPVAPEPEEELDVPVSTLVATLQTLIGHLESDRDLSRTGRDEIINLGAEMKAGLERIGSLEKRFAIAVEKAEQIASRGWMVVPFAGTPPPELPPKVPSPAELAARLPSAAARPKQFATRKPRVLVLNLPGGSEKHGCTEGAKSSCSLLDYRDAEDNKFPNQWEQYDYIISTKWTDRIDGWYRTALTMEHLKGRLIQCPGGVRDKIVPRIVSLPEIKFEVKNPDEQG
jgi:hypothetical protein